MRFEKRKEPVCAALVATTQAPFIPRKAVDASFSFGLTAGTSLFEESGEPDSDC